MLDIRQNRASTTIRANSIVIPEGREIVGEIGELVESIKSYGVLQPIGVRRALGDGPVLVWGYKRLKALLSIDANAEIEIIDLGTITDDEAAVAEIEENLRRHQYTLEQRAAQTARSVELRTIVIAAHMEAEKLSVKDGQKLNGRPPEARAKAVRDEATAQGKSRQTIESQLRTAGVGVDSNAAPKKAKMHAPSGSTRAHGKVTKRKVLSLDALKRAYDEMGTQSKLKLLEHIRDSMSTTEWSAFIATSPPRAIPTETPDMTVQQ